MGKNGRHLDIYKFRNTCLFIYLFIHWLDRCPTQLNCEVFVRGKTQRTSTHLIPDSLHLKSFHHFRTYGCYSCTHNSVCSLLARCRASVKTHTQTYTNTHTDPLASFSFIFRNGMETEWNYLTMLAWYQAKAHITNSQRLNRCIDRFLVILNRFRGPRINLVASVLIQSDTDLYRWIITPLIFMFYMNGILPQILCLFGFYILCWSCIMFDPK